MLKNRRSFLKSTSQTVAASSALLIMPQSADPCGKKTSLEEENIIGPKHGYTPHIGSLVSMMNWMRDVVLSPVRGLSTAELDYLHDKDSNSIGAMLWHLAATERFYYLNTFEDRSWGDWPDKDDKEFSTAMSLGNRGRANIKGNPLDFYLEKLNRVRNITLEGLKTKDDDWLLRPDNSWGWGPTNNYCKWFHVVEHESNHNGQIKYIKSRIEL